MSIPARLPPILRLATLAVAVVFGLDSGAAGAAAEPGRIPVQDLQAPPSQTPPSQALDPAPDDAELGRFVSAFMRLIGVQHGYMMMMQAEPDPQRREAIRAGAYDHMRAAVQRDGMQVERYDSIATALRSDPDLQGRVQTIIEQLAQAQEDVPPDGPAPD